MGVAYLNNWQYILAYRQFKYPVEQLAKAST